MPPRPQDQQRRQPPPKKPLKQLDLNTDYGQSDDRSYFDRKERTLLHFVSSANIPCCVHDGDPKLILEDIKKAHLSNCAVGAHIGYPDPQHYGYQPLDLDEDELIAWVLIQLGAFYAMCRANRIEFGHVRPHGALYSQFVTDPKIATTVAKAIKQFDPWMQLIAPMGDVAEQVQADTNLQIAQELYLGKRLNAQGGLDLERFSETLHPQSVFEQVRQLIFDGCITTEDGKTKKVNCSTMHISPKLQGSLVLAERIHTLLNSPTAVTLTTAGNAGWL